MEKIRLQGSTVVEAEVVDRYTESSGITHGVALIDGMKVPVIKYHEDDTHWYVDVGEIIR